MQIPRLGFLECRLDKFAVIGLSVGLGFFLGFVGFLRLGLRYSQIEGLIGRNSCLD